VPPVLLHLLVVVVLVVLADLLMLLLLFLLEPELEVTDCDIKFSLERIALCCMVLGVYRSCDSCNNTL
jgi:hypothetical protein